MGEFRLLQHVFAANRELGATVEIPPGDDMAMLRIGDRSVLLGVDQLTAGLHFDPSVGWGAGFAPDSAFPTYSRGLQPPLGYLAAKSCVY